MKRSRAFTIVELVIVIAVIGVLSAVLIPTFINLLAKANQASSELLVRNLNNSLAIHEIEEGKNRYPLEAIEDIATQGYTEADLKVSDDTIYWNDIDNRFYLKSKISNNVSPYHYWEFVSSYNPSTTHPIYALEGFITDTIENLKVGFDVGRNFTITSISTSNSNVVSEDMIIRTNDGSNYVTTLIVDGDNSSISHYGNLISLDIISTSIDTYKEYGKIKDYLLINKGKVILEPTSKVDRVLVENATSDVIVETYIDTDIYIDTISSSMTTTITHDTGTVIHDDAGALVSNASSLITALSSSGDIKLTSDIDLSSTSPVSGTEHGILLVGTGLTSSINLNGHNIVCSNENKYIFENRGNFTLYDLKNKGQITAKKGILIDIGGNTVIENGYYVVNIQAANPKNYTMFYHDLSNPSSNTFTINGGTFVSSVAVLKSVHGTININGGNFNSVWENIIQLHYDATVNIKDAEFYSTKGIFLTQGSGKMTIKNCKATIEEAETTTIKSIAMFTVTCVLGETITRQLEVDGGSYTSKTSGRPTLAITKDGDGSSTLSNCSIELKNFDIKSFNMDGSENPNALWLNNFPGTVLENPTPFWTFTNLTVNEQEPVLVREFN